MVKAKKTPISINIWQTNRRCLQATCTAKTIMRPWRRAKSQNRPQTSLSLMTRRILLKKRIIPKKSICHLLRKVIILAGTMIIKTWSLTTLVASTKICYNRSKRSQLKTKKLKLTKSKTWPNKNQNSLSRRNKLSQLTKNRVARTRTKTRSILKKKVNKFRVK